MRFVCHGLFYSMLMVGDCAADSIKTNVQDAVTVQDIVELRNFSDVLTCAGSKLIAARVDRPSIAQNRVNHEWNIIDWPSGNIRATADAGESLNTRGQLEPSYPQWSQDCRWLYYRALHHGEVQIWRVDAISGAQENVTDDDSDILNLTLADSGDALIYETSAPRDAILAAEAREYQNGVLLNESIFPTSSLTKAELLFGRWATWRAWSGDDMGRVVHGHLLSQEPPRYKTMIIRDRKVRTATESEIAEITKPAPDWAPQLNSSYLVSIDGNQAALVLTKKKGAYSTPLLTVMAAVRRENPSNIHYCSDDRCTADTLVPLKWSEDGSSIYFIAERQRGAAGIYEWAPVSDKVRTVVETDGILGALASGGRRYRSGSCPVIEDIAFCTAADPENPPRLMAIPLTSGSVKTVLHPNADLRKRFTLKTERITWKDDLEREAVGVLVYPRNFKKGVRYPLVMTTYWCPGFLSGGIADGGPEYVLAENGFLVLCVDRNPDVYVPGVYEALGDKYSNAEARYMGYLAEFESAIDMLVKKGFADRHRVGVTGLSMSTQGVSYALTRSNIFHVAALRSIGVIEPALQMRLRPGMVMADFIFKDHGVVGSESNIKAAFENLSLTLRAERVTAAILVQPSESEYLWSLPSFAALHKLGKPIEMIVFPDETHMLHQPVHRFVNFTRNLDWFRFWLQAHEDPDPEKAEQYARWRKMRDERCAWDEPIDKKPTYCDYASSQETVH